MKKIFLLICLVGSFACISQTTSNYYNSPNAKLGVKKVKQPTLKSYGDTLWSEDFNGGLPTCWSIVNNNPNNFQWQWDTVHRAGQYSQGIPKINSTTSNNGFMLLPMDWYNTPLPMSGVPMDTYFQSCAILISPRASIALQFQEFSRFCCSNRAKIVLQVSTDNFQTFDEYNLNDLFINQMTANVKFSSVNISRTLAYQDTAYIRFYMEGMSHYFWMIDDLALVEGNGQEVQNPRVNPLVNLSTPPLTMLPVGYSNNYVFSGEVKSTTGDTVTNLNLEVEVLHETFLNGIIGNGTVYSQNNLVNGNGVLYPLDTAFINTTTPWFSPLITGNYKVQYSSSSRQYPQVDVVESQFAISDTVFARDYNEVTSQTAPYFYSSNGNPTNLDAMGIIYALDSSIANLRFSSVSVYVSNSSGSIGAEVRPVIWEYDSLSNLSNSGVGRRVASSLTTVVLDTSDVDSWLTLKLDTGLAFRRPSNNGLFLVGWEEISSGPFITYSTLLAGADLRSAKIAPPKSVYSKAGPGGVFQPVPVIPMIRLNIKPLLVGIDNVERVENSIQIYPNPSSGIFAIESVLKVKSIQVYSTEGRLSLSILNQNKLDLGQLPNGIYFAQIELENGEIISKKLVKF